MKLVIAMLFSASVWAQGPGGPPGFGRGGGPPRSRLGPPSSDIRTGNWWTNPMTIRRLGLTEDQQKRLDQIYQQSRLKLIDLRAALEREEATIEPMLASEHPQESAVNAQIDRIANARADLEKVNARMLFGFRLILSPDQWKELQSHPVGPRDTGPGGGLGRR